MSKTKYSEEAKKRNMAYVNGYNKDNYDRITILRKKGDAEKLQALAKLKGKSRNELLNEIIDCYLQNQKVVL